MNVEMPVEPTLGTCAVFSLRRASRIVTRIYEQHLRFSGLSANQFITLSVLHRVGPKTVSKLALELGMDRTTLSRDLRPLERKGFVSLVPLPTDRRTKMVALSSAGKSAYNLALPAWSAAQQRVFTALGEGEWVDVLTALSTIDVSECMPDQVQTAAHTAAAQASS